MADGQRIMNAAQVRGLLLKHGAKLSAQAKGVNVYKAANGGIIRVYAQGGDNFLVATQGCECS